MNDERIENSKLGDRQTPTTIKVEVKNESLITTLAKVTVGVIGGIGGKIWWDNGGDKITKTKVEEFKAALVKKIPKPKITTEVKK